MYSVHYYWHLWIHEMVFWITSSYVFGLYFLRIDNQNYRPGCNFDTTKMTQVGRQITGVPQRNKHYVTHRIANRGWLTRGLTHWGLVTPYGFKHLDQHLFGYIETKMSSKSRIHWNENGCTESESCPFDNFWCSQWRKCLHFCTQCTGRRQAMTRINVELLFIGTLEINLSEI